MRAKKEEKQVLISNVIKFESEKLTGLVIDGNKRNTVSQWEMPISWDYFVTRVANRDIAQEHEEQEQSINQSRSCKSNPKREELNQSQRRTNVNLS